MWDERYAGDDYIFGTEPAAFLAAAEALLPRGARVLCLAEGEGRNAVFLAGRGHRVTGIDLSEVGLAKAARLAAARGVAVELRRGDVMTWDGGDGPWDAVVAVFIHFRAEERARLAAALARGMGAGGLFLFHAYGPGQIALGTGGPKDRAMLADAGEVVADFAGWEVLAARDHEAVLAEGSHHVGQSALVDVILRHPGLFGAAEAG